MNYIQKREGYSAIKALAAVNNAIIQLMVYGVPSLNRGWFFYRNGREVRNHNVLIYLCVDVNGEVKDLHSQFNIIYIMRTNINQGRIQSLAVHDCSAH